MEIEELFGTLQQATVITWRKHLQTSKNSVHEILDDFYKDLPDLVDKLIEDYMGANGKVSYYKNILDGKEYTAVEYLEKLRDIVKQGRDMLDDEEVLESDLDDIESLITTTLYKLRELTNESKKLDIKAYILERLEII